jgi:hypothetical protein
MLSIFLLHSNGNCLQQVTCCCTVLSRAQLAAATVGKQTGELATTSATAQLQCSPHFAASLQLHQQPGQLAKCDLLPVPGTAEAFLSSLHAPAQVALSAGGCLHLHQMSAAADAAAALWLMLPLALL